MGTFDCGIGVGGDGSAYDTCDETFDSLVEMHRHRHEEHDKWLPPFAREDDDG